MRSEPPQPRLVLIRWSTERELLAEARGDFSPKLSGPLVVHRDGALRKTERLAELLLIGLLHADQQPNLVTITAGPTIDRRIKNPPPAEVEIPNAVVSMCRRCERLTKCRGKVRLTKIVEDSRHSAEPAWKVMLLPRPRDYVPAPESGVNGRTRQDQDSHDHQTRHGMTPIPDRAISHDVKRAPTRHQLLTRIIRKHRPRHRPQLQTTPTSPPPRPS